MSLETNELSVREDKLAPGTEQAKGKSQSLRILAAVVVIIAAGLWAYHNSFSGPFIFDDAGSIAKNPNIRQLWPIWEVFQTQAGETAAGRPVLSLSLALNYQVSGLEVWSYHAVNLAIHILAALTLFGLIRRTLLCEKLRARFGQASFSLALICALIWMLHPLQTGSVTYIVQRAESLMGLFYLLSLYCAIRGFSSTKRPRWYIFAILACALGMGTKEVVATAPFVVWLYDRIFVSRSFKEALTRRWGLYGGLAGTWVIFGVLAFTSPRGESVSFAFEDLSWLEYAMTQCQVIVGYYLKLSFWPYPLVLDYGWPIVRSFGQIVPHALVLVTLLVGTVVALRYWPSWGFLGVWFFVILAPSSSFVIIISEVAAEHRMYLPLAAVVVAVVLGGYVILARWSISGTQRAGLSQNLGYILAGGVIVTLGLLTIKRNYDYASEFSIWDATVIACPDNPRAYNNRGRTYWVNGEHELAIRDFDAAIKLNSSFAGAYYNRGITYLSKGEPDRAIHSLDKAIELNPADAQAYNDRGLAYSSKGKLDRGIDDFNRSIDLDPGSAEAHNNRGFIYGLKSQYERATRDFNKALELDPSYASAYNNRGRAYWSKGEYARATRDFEKAIQLALANGNQKFAKHIQSNMKLYKAKRPYREPSSPD